MIPRTRSTPSDYWDPEICVTPDLVVFRVKPETRAPMGDSGKPESRVTPGTVYPVTPESRSPSGDYGNPESSG